MSGMNQHVIPSGDRWAVRRVGASRSSKVFETREEAVAAARSIARNNSADLYIHDRDGRISQRVSFGKSPISIRG
jgi:hypothetical protein